MRDEEPRPWQDNGLRHSHGRKSPWLFSYMEVLMIHEDRWKSTSEALDKLAEERHEKDDDK